MTAAIGLACSALALAGAAVGADARRRHALVGVAIALPLTLATGPAPIVALGVIVVAALIAGSAPARHRHRTQRARLRAIERSLPDALDLLAGTIEAGTPLGAALANVAGHLDGPVADELEACAARLRSPSGSRRDALVALAHAGSPDLSRVGYALATADELGAPIADLLREQAALQRELDRLRIRERAASASPKIALVVSLVLVPSGLLIVLGSQALKLLADIGA